MAELVAIGGLTPLMKMLLDEGLLHGDALTVTGQTLAENLKRRRRYPDGPGHRARLRRARSRRTAISSFSTAISRPTARWRRSAARKASASPARRIVFDREEAALEAILRGRVKKGHVDRHPLRGPARRAGHARDAVADQRDHGPRARARTWRSSPTAASAAARTASSSATSRRRRTRAVRWRWSRTATRSPSTRARGR